MRAPGIRTRRIVTLSSAPVAILLAGFMVWQGTNAAFSADTRNIGSNWETGSVAISDDDSGAAMFAIQNVVPGQTGQKCIVVTASPTVASTVKTYVGDLAPDGLQDFVKVTVEQGTGGSFADCNLPTLFTPTATEPSQSLTGLFTDHVSYTTGILPWVTGPGTATKTYKITWVFDVSSLNGDQALIDGLQGHGTSINFEWEMQNN